MENYELVKEIGSGSFGSAKLMRNKSTKELVAVKFIHRGHRIDGNVEKEVMNHKRLRHPNIVRFKEVFLTPTHLAIAMEFAAGGMLFERIKNLRRFSEDEARFFFQQLICGVSYCHSLEVRHRDLKLENTLLDGSPAPRVKLCDFGFSTTARGKETVGTPTYMAPEVFSHREYDGKLADVWSCGVLLYTMLVGVYPFEDRQDPNNFRKTIERIVSASYKIPESIHISKDCKHLLFRIFVANPSTRITIYEIRRHPWFLKNLPKECTEAAQAIHHKGESANLYQSNEQILAILKEARSSPSITTSIKTFIPEEEEEEEEEEEDNESDGEEAEYENRVRFDKGVTTVGIREYCAPNCEQEQ